VKFRWWALIAIIASLFSFALAIAIIFFWLWLKITLLGLKFIDWLDQKWSK